MHANANITCAMQETKYNLTSALSLQPKDVGGGGKSWEEQLMELSVDMGKRFPDLYDVEKIMFISHLVMKIFAFGVRGGY